MPSPCGASRCGEKQLGLPPPPRPRHTTEARSGAVRSYRAYQFTADQHPPDFVRTCANIEQFGVAHIALDRPILRISRTAQCLNRSEEHTSELQSLMRLSYAVFFLKKNTITNNQRH